MKQLLWVFFACAAFVPTVDAQQLYNMYDYFIMPEGRVLSRYTVRWPADGSCIGEQAPTLDVRNYGWWRGSLWRRSIFLQTGPQPSTYDVYADSNNNLEYWGTFRGNAYTADDAPFGMSHGFATGFTFFRRWMAVGNVLTQTFEVSELRPGWRYAKSTTPNTTQKVEILAHLGTFTDPDSGITYSDVIKFRYNDSETYWQARDQQGKAIGTIRFETTNCREPSSVKRTWLAYYEDGVPFDNMPTLPWYDPVKYWTFVRNGYMEHFAFPPTDGAPVTGNLIGWSGSSGDAVISRDAGDSGQQPWKILLRGSASGGDTSADHAISTTTVSDPFIPVLPGQRYTLSGYLWRTDARDNVYLDFNDGFGRSQTQEFADVHATATQTNVWEYHEATATAGPSTTGIRVRCVRDGVNVGNALCDGVTLTRTPVEIVEYNDVPRCNAFYPSVEAISWYGITGGCGGGNYCPDVNIPREQMAVFVVVAQRGNFYSPPSCVVAPFSDVPTSHPFCRWIAAAKTAGIMLGGTSEGCPPGYFCPTDPVTRDQMAAFVLRAREGASYSPPACVAGNEVFSDVPASNPYCRWIEELWRRNVVTGCGGGQYCPTQPNTRGQMAVFISATYGFRSPLPLCP